MNLSLKPYDIQRNLLVERYKNGIRLIKPSDDEEHVNSISSIYNMPEPWFFLDTASQFVSGNEDLSKLVNAESVEDMQGRNAANFCSREFSTVILANDQSIMRSRSMKIIEEAGNRKDNMFLHALALKLPWYHDDKVIGLLGCSVMIDANSLTNTAKSLTQIMMAGLLSQDVAAPLKALSTANDSNVYYSRREMEISKAKPQDKSVR